MEVSPQADHHHWQEEDDQTHRDGRGSSSELWRSQGSSLLNNNVALRLRSAGLDDPGRPLWLKLVLLVELLLTALPTALTIVVLTVLLIPNTLPAPSSRAGALAVAVLVVVAVIAEVSAAVISRVVGIFWKQKPLNINYRQNCKI